MEKKKVRLKRKKRRNDDEKQKQKEKRTPSFTVACVTLHDTNYTINKDPKLKTPKHGKRQSKM